MKEILSKGRFLRGLATTSLALLLVVGVAQAAVTITTDTLTGSTDANITATADDVVLTSGDDIMLDADGALANIITLDAYSATNTSGSVVVDFGTGNMILTGTGASADFTLDADLFSIDGTGTANITVTGAANEDFTIAQAASADASLFVTSSGTGSDALQITTTGTSGDMIIDSTAGTLIVDAGEAAADALLLRATGGTTATAHLTSNGTGTAAVDIDSTATGGDVDIDSADAVDILAAGVFSIDGTGNSNVTATSGSLTLSTAATGVLTLSSAGNTTLDVAAGGLLSIDVAAVAADTALANNISVAAHDGTAAQTFTIALTGAADDVDDFTIQAAGAEGDLVISSGDSASLTVADTLILGDLLTNTAAASVAIYSIDWEISTTGDMTGIGAVTTNGLVTIARVISADSATTNNWESLTFATPIDTTGTNVHQGLNVTTTVANATGGTNTANMINLAAVTGDAQVSLNAINIGALTGTGATENAITIGDGWDKGITGATYTIDGTTALTVGAGTGTIAINSSDWDIDATGIMTGIGAVTTNGLVTIARVISADSATTNNWESLTFATPIDTTGTNVHQGLNVTTTVANATGGTNTANMINLAAVTGDAQVSLNAINIGALTGTGAAENAITIGDGWDKGITGATYTIDGTTALTVGAGAGTIAINSSDWDIGTTGDMTGIGAITASGVQTVTGTDGSLVNLSAATNTTTAVVNKGLIIPISADCAAGTTEGQICWDSDGDTLYIGSSGGIAAISPSTTSANTWTNVNTFQDNEIFTFGADEDIAIDSATTDTTVTTGVLNIDVDAGNAAVDGINIDLEAAGTITGATDITAIDILLTATDTDADLFGITMATHATAGIAASYDAGILIDNTDDTAGSMLDAIRITSSGVDAGITDAIDVSAAFIDNAINVGTNDIEGTTATITFTDFTVGADGNVSILNDAGDALTITLAAGDLQAIVIDAAAAVNASSDGLIDLNIATVTDGFEGINMDLQVDDDAGIDTVMGAYLNIDNNATTADDVVYGVYINNEDGAAAADALIYLNQADTDTAVASGIFFNVAAGAITNAIDATDAEIVNAINVGTNDIEGTTATITFTDFIVDADGLITLLSDGAGDQITATAGNADYQFLVLDAATVDNTTTAGVIDLNIDAGNAAVDGINIDLEAAGTITAATDITAIEILLTATDADADLFGITMATHATIGAAASYDAGILIDNTDDTAGSMLDAIRITSSGVDAGITDAIDVSAAFIGNAINVGGNPITGTTWNLNATTALTLGDAATDTAGATVAIFSSDWEIDTTGAMTGIGAIALDGAISGGTSGTFSTFVAADAYRVTNGTPVTVTGAITKANLQAASFFLVNTTSATAIAISLGGNGESFDAGDIGRTITFAQGANTGAVTVGANDTITVGSFAGAGGAVDAVGDLIECKILKTTLVTCLSYASN